ncbi:MAG: sigma-E processing peptidase SpoIIGA [Desulfitobacteriaceae bacterium]|nr:sigma-E processing peptidase SpoIIGA [Desulfitobacteriaceae bacterium]MDD4752675.1 sigma-E processing peptidase SpoIIGA [Desulfitobacteriaceae bacterium]
MQETYIIYADMIFFINFLLDLAILWATAKFGHLPTTRIRLAFGALIGSFYAVFMIHPRASILYLISVKILFSLFIIAVTFPKLTLRKYFQATAYFYLISFTMAGAVLGCSSIFSKSNFVFQDISVTCQGLFFALIIAAIIGGCGIKYLKKNWRKNRFQVPVQVLIGQSSVIVEALIDTGNDLRDPLTQKPVMIVEYQAVKKILPEEFCRQFERYSTTDITRIVEHLTDTSWAKRIRVIPFNTIGKHHGMLLGFKPDLVIVFGGRKAPTKDVVVCLYHHTLSSGGTYRAVMNPEVLETAA